MWTVLLWILGVGTVAASILFIVLLFKNKQVRNKPVLMLKYICLALAPITLGLGRIVTDSDTGKDKAMCLGIFFLILTAAAAYLGDTKKDF